MESVTLYTILLNKNGAYTIVENGGYSETYDTWQELIEHITKIEL